MILFDIRSMVDGLDIKAWYELMHKENICLYDSKAGPDKPLPPFAVDDKVNSDYVVLIDVRTMTDEELKVLNEAVTNIAKDRYEQNEEARMILRQNNERLIKYLKNINDETEGKNARNEV